MSISPKIPTLNQIITLMIALAVISFVVKLLPANIQNLFRV